MTTPSSDLYTLLPHDKLSVCIYSDFLIKKMGLETAVAAASAYVPHPAKLSEGKQEKLTGTAVEPVRVINCTGRCN